MVSDRKISEAPVSQPVDLRLVGLRKSFGAVPAVRGVDLTVPAGSIVSLIGPSGCGKTTTLRMIAGLERPDAGEIIIGNTVLTQGRKVVPPERRDMGMVFQSYALWPHMTVARNIAYGLRNRGVAEDAAARKVASVLELVNMGQFAERYPSQLSGGQQQRVALARAIATEPRTLLFDEPLSNLDAVLREQMRFEIRSLQQRLGITALYVTHSQDEALVISDTIAIMNHGTIVQYGTPTNIYNEPKSAFVATFIGLANILQISDVEPARGSARGRLSNGSLVTVAGGELDTTGPKRSLKVSVRPEDVVLKPSGEQALNCFEGTVRVASFAGGFVDYFIELSGGIELRVRTTPPVQASAGEAVTLRVPPEKLIVLADE
jgi:iron(III) transport system ATP-binding protein